MITTLPIEIQLGTYSPVRDITIKRPQWYHGRSGVESRLLRESDGQKCCLGFYALALGFEPWDIMGKLFLGKQSAIPDVDDISNKDIEATHEAAWLNLEYPFSANKSTVSYHLARLNDDENMSGDAAREKQIANVFMKYGGVRVTFVD